MVSDEKEASRGTFNEKQRKKNKPKVKFIKVINKWHSISNVTRQIVFCIGV